MESAERWHAWRALAQSGVFLAFFMGYLGQANRGWNGPIGPVLRWEEPASKAPWLRLGIVKTDAWMAAHEDGALTPWSEFPLQRHPDGLLDGAHFSPEAYLAQVQEFIHQNPGRCDVIMYYGGRRHNEVRQGLNFNSWSLEDLHKLQAMGGRPFIGLETLDPALVYAMAETLAAGGFKDTRIYIRIASEPSTMHYGTLEGTSKGQRHTRACYAAYKKRFLSTARLLRRLGRRYGMDFQIVFAGDSAEDFDHYLPDPDQVDAIGFDLYLTPANSVYMKPLLERVMNRFRDKPVVIPELGIATDGLAREPGRPSVRATPAWAQAALADVLDFMGRHPGHVTQLTVFSVNVAGRLESRRWNWAWTPAMFDMLQEWQADPPHWKLQGFHRYDPLTYPFGKDVLYEASPSHRIFYRKLTEAVSDSKPVFLETAYVFEGSGWTRQRRKVRFTDEGLLETLGFQPD